MNICFHRLLAFRSRIWWISWRAICHIYEPNYQLYILLVKLRCHRRGNGTVANLTVQEDTNGDLFNVFLPIVAGVDSTMYFTNPDASCGDGCSIVEAFEASSNTSYYYNCNITVGTVMNAARPEHKVGIQLREMASAGIALQRYDPGANLPLSKQFQVYPSESTYGSPHSGHTDGIGSTISMFAISVVSVAAFYNPNTFNVPASSHRSGINPLLIIGIGFG